MLHGGREPCDGELRPPRCIRCALGGRGVPAPLAALAASPIGIAASRRGRGRLRIPALIERAASDFRGMLDEVDHVVAVCGWGRDLLLRNGAASERLTLSRQGVAGAHTGRPPGSTRQGGGPLRIAYYGRLDPAKSVGLLVDAVRAAPSARVAVDLYLVQAEDGANAALRARCAGDGRIVVKPTLAPSQVSRSMAEYDLVAVPSSGLETGPLVVLEAWAAGVPVLGAKRGGIAELVRDGVDGLLIPPGDVDAWSGAIARLAAAPELIERLRGNIRPPRTMAQVAAEMAEVYRRVLAGSERAQTGSFNRRSDAEATAR
jgi:glycosyltransferase involved in cell wall biosynthesis